MDYADRPSFCLYSSGLSPPRDILIRFSRYSETELADAKARLDPEEFARWAEKAQTPASFMKAAEEQSFGTNMAFFIGQGSLREKALGYSDAAPTKEQMEIMQKDLIEAMEAG